MQVGGWRLIERFGGDDGEREAAVIAHCFEVELAFESVDEGAVIGDVQRFIGRGGRAEYQQCWCEGVEHGQSRAMGATTASVSDWRSAGARLMSSPRRPALT
jgi:hypothetical protein